MREEIENIIPILFPCPFCGSAAEFRNDYFVTILDQAQDERIMQGVWVSCEECKCELGRCGDEHDEGAFETMNKAASAWNTRTEDHRAPNER